MGHQGSVERKIQSIEYLDREADTPGERGTGRIGRGLPDADPSGSSYACEGADTCAEPVPYLLYDSTAPRSHNWHYNEKEALESGIKVEHGWDMMKYLFGGKLC